MNKLAIATLSVFTLFCACKKKDTTPTPTVTTPTNPYYFKFKLNDSTFNMAGGFPQYIYLYDNESGGYEANPNTFSPAAWLSLTVPDADTIKESDLMGLSGRTIYFNDTLLHPKVGYDYDLGGLTSWESVDTADHSYYVTISNITFLKNDTALGSPVRAYVITGTCNALVQKNGIMTTLSGGDFNFIIARKSM